MGNASRSDDDLARAGDPLDPRDAEAHSAGYDLPALLHLRMDVLKRTVLRSSPEVVHLKQSPLRVRRSPHEHDPLATDWVDQLISRARHQLDLGRRIPYSASIDALYSLDSSLVQLVEAVRALPYGRPSDRTVEGMLREQRGTCSTKHLFLARVLAERFPETAPRIVHRVYTLDQARARELFGAEVAAVVPDGGLVDVHRYLTIMLGEKRVEIDATFPGPAWDGRSSLALACGAGTDFPAGDDPDAEKRALEEQHCNRAIREPFIAALSSARQE